MVRYVHLIPIIFIYLAILSFAVSSYAEEEIEDQIDIIESENKIIAIIKGIKGNSFDLRANEKVLWSGSRGNLGAFLTNLNFFVISTTSNSWHVLPLKERKFEQRTASISPYIALLATKYRIIIFNAESNRFIETRIPTHDELLEAEAEKYVSVVITTGRVFGFTLGTSTFIEMPFRIRETFDSMNITASKAVVRTSDRLLTFEAKNSTWREHRL